MDTVLCTYVSGVTYHIRAVTRTRIDAIGG